MEDLLKRLVLEQRIEAHKKKIEEALKGDSTISLNELQQDKLSLQAELIRLNEDMIKV